MASYEALPFCLERVIVPWPVKTSPMNFAFTWICHWYSNLLIGQPAQEVFGIAWISYNQSDTVGIAYVVWSWYWWNVRVIHDEEGVRDDTPLWYPLSQIKWISNGASKFYLCSSFRKLPSSLQSESGRLASSNCARSPSSLWHTTEDDVAVFL